MLCFPILRAPRTLSRWAILTIACLAISPALPAPAQTFTVLHNFTGGPDGAAPYAGITLDRAGNLYGTTTAGGTTGLGTVFELKQAHGSWVLNPLYQMQQQVAALPMGRVVFGPDGSLYGISSAGGTGTGRSAPGDDPCPQGCGAVFKLQPPATSCKTSICNWAATPLYSFTGGSDGYNPGFVDPVFDAAGNLYGTTEGGGVLTCGAVFELTPSHGQWTESVIYSFDCGGGTGFTPSSGVIFDAAGNLYGTAANGGGYNGGTVYQLSHSGSGWTGVPLYVFQGADDGSEPTAPVLFDREGNLFTAAIGAGPHNDGTVIELARSGGEWTFALVYGFNNGRIYGGPNGNLVMDGVGNIYGTTYLGGAFSNGSVFKLNRTGGEWIYTSLHDFTGQDDGGDVLAGVTLDANGNLYGTAAMGGTYGKGVVWEITPN